MGLRRLQVLILTAFMAMNLFMPMNGLAQTQTSSVAGSDDPAIAETYRVAAETWKGHAIAERAKRKAAEQDAANALKLAESWKVAAQSNTRARTPEWVWPSVAATVVVSFVVGFAVAWRVPRPGG